ncbi:MAG TPA: hypothetical protein VGV89_08885 [Thermoplasmata archaeon]|nr:hypothetical protein [Thermoplasmata archaeon]
MPALGTSAILSARSPARRRAVLSAATVLAVVALTGPLAVGATSGPPWKGWTSTNSQLATIGCAAQSQAQPPVFYPTNGTFQFAATARAATCHHAGGPFARDSQIFDQFDTYFGTHLSVPAGRHTVRLNFTADLNASGTESASGPCPYTSNTSGNYTFAWGLCDAEVTTRVIMSAYVQDNVNGSQFAQSGIFEVNDSVINSSTVSFYCWKSTFQCTSLNQSLVTASTHFGGRVGRSGSVNLSTTFLRGRSYTLVVDFHVLLFVGAAYWSTAHARATIDAAGSGKGVTLTALRVT